MTMIARRIISRIRSDPFMSNELVEHIAKSGRNPINNAGDRYMEIPHDEHNYDNKNN